MLRAWFYRFARDRKANVAVIVALTMVPIIFLLGMTLDFTQALRKKEQLDAAADAAAIAAVRPAMLMQTDAVAQATAYSIFMSAANSLSGLVAVPTPTITVTDVGLQRTVSVTYTAASINNFPKVLLNTASWPIQGSATAQAAAAPNMNFYLLMDDCPQWRSARLPPTSAISSRPPPPRNSRPLRRRIAASPVMKPISLTTAGPGTTSRSHGPTVSPCGLIS